MPLITPLAIPIGAVLRARSRRVRHIPSIILLCAALAGCATPVSVRRANPRAVHQMLTGNVLSNGRLSLSTQNTLRRWNLFERASREPEQVLAQLHATVNSGAGGSNELSALAELAYFHAESTGQRTWYLAAALYAYAYLFPETEDQCPSPFDPRQRLACDLYNRSLTNAFASADRHEVELREGTYPLPFGELKVDFNPDALSWLGRSLDHFVPIAELKVRGLTNRYRRPGIGAPLAAAANPVATATLATVGADGFVSPDLKVAATAFLRLAEPRRQLAGSSLRATLELHTNASAISINGLRVPLESEPTAAYASMLADPQIWRQEITGFLHGDFSLERPTRLTALRPYVPGRIPVVLVHGTASSSGRWADLVNELENDPSLHDRIQLWLFTYDTGNPVAYSAMLLRQSLQQTFDRLQRDGRDPALSRMILVGHSQGGLLIKLAAVDSGNALWATVSGKPLNALHLRPQTRDLLRQSYFTRPLPFVHRLVYVAVPHQGSFVAGRRLSNFLARFIKLPKEILDVSGELVQGDLAGAFFSATHRMPISVDDMTPGQPFNRALAALPVAPGVTAHSIIAVKGDGPAEKGNDGVVKYASAHVVGVASERVVRSGHSCQSCPEVIDEVRRIVQAEVDEER